ncbi:MAG: hypothetical protein C4337_07885 [Armatimonadota bacterium]
MDCKPVPETNRLEPRALPRFFVTLDVLRSAVLPDAVAHQVHHGLCLRRGDAICLLDGAGIAWIAQLTEKGRFRIIGRQPVPTEPALQVTLLQALIRTEKLETAIRLCVQAGAAALRIAPSQRSIVRLEKVGEREEAVIPLNELRGYTNPLAHGGSPWYEQVSPVNPYLEGE